MKQEEKQLLLKDLCARLPYGVKVHVEHNEREREWYGISGYDTTVTTDSIGKLVSNFKPYLRPLSSMTEEEQQKYYDLTHQEDDDIWAKCLFDKMVDFCNEKHLDYRGLIPMGLALEATEGMYK